MSVCVPADCGSNAHPHVRQANHIRKDDPWNCSPEEFARFHSQRRTPLVATFINGLQGQTRELKMELLEACRKDLQDLGIAVADVARLIRP